jgi:outer membrane protein assembly factor BamB
MTPDGERKWASGMNQRFGLGPYLIADGRIWVMNDHGVLTLAEATPEAYQPLGSWKILDGEETWGPLVLVDGRLIARSRNSMVCVDVRAK